MEESDDDVDIFEGDWSRDDTRDDTRRESIDERSEENVRERSDRTYVIRYGTDY